MDLWVIAATAAAGCIGKHWQNLSKCKDKSIELSSEGIEYGLPESPVCPFNLPTNRKKPKYGILNVGREKLGADCLHTWQCDDASETEHGESSRTGLGGDLMNTTDGFEGGSEMHSSCDRFKNGTFLRRKQPYRPCVKPLSSLESCLMAQLRKDLSTVEEYVLGPFPSPSTPFTRPLLVTDGTQVINRTSGDYFCMQTQKKDKHGHFYGVSQPPKLESLDIFNKMKLKRSKGLLEKASSSSKHLPAHQQDGSASNDAAFLFCLGISVGILSSSVASKNEVDRLNKALKQTENLVQDLKEELEMNNSVTVKDLSNENSGCADELDNVTEPCNEKVGVISASMSKIEAELEAELERLELNISTSGIGRSMDIVEVGAEFVQGELRADRMAGQDSDHMESNDDRSDNSTPRSGNFTVSPRDLSVRLHEVIQSQLEERIRELETALQQSERKVGQLMESERKNSWSKIWETQELRRFDDLDNGSSKTQPLVMNLAGEALDAYNEGYEELMKINESEEEDSSTSLSQKDYATSFTGMLRESRSRTTEEHEEFSGFQELLDDGMSDEEDEENSDLEDELDKQLIQQIIQKTKQGSPVVLNAQKILFLMDD